MLDWNFLVFIGALTIAGFTPGPGVAALIATVLAHGSRQALWFSIGIILGDLVWLALSLSGLALIAQQFPIVFIVIKWAGVAYLMVLAIKIWFSPTQISKIPSKSHSYGPYARIGAGFSLTMGNPKTILFYLALLPSIVSPETLSLPLITGLAIGVIVVLSFVFAVYTFAASKARKFLANSQSMRTFNRITAMVLGSAATWIALR
jgi:threonine/homoserine/homoserine lactone efflux protein